MFRDHLRASPVEPPTESPGCPTSRHPRLADQRSCAIQSSCGSSRYAAKAISSRGDTPMYISYGRSGPKIPCVRMCLPRRQLTSARPSWSIGSLQVEDPRSISGPSDRAQRGYDFGVMARHSPSSAASLEKAAFSTPDLLTLDGGLACVAHTCVTHLRLLESDGRCRPATARQPGPDCQLCGGRAAARGNGAAAGSAGPLLRWPHHSRRARGRVAIGSADAERGGGGTRPRRDGCPAMPARRVLVLQPAQSLRQ